LLHFARMRKRSWRSEKDLAKLVLKQPSRRLGNPGGNVKMRRTRYLNGCGKLNNRTIKSFQYIKAVDTQRLLTEQILFK